MVNAQGEHNESLSWEEQRALRPMCMELLLLGAWRPMGNPAMIAATRRPTVYGVAHGPRPQRVVRNTRRHRARRERHLVLARRGEGAGAPGRVGLRKERHPESDPRASRWLARMREGRGHREGEGRE